MKTDPNKLERLVKATLQQLDEFNNHASATAASIATVRDVILNVAPTLAPQLTLLKESLTHTQHLAEHVTPQARESLLALLPKAARPRVIPKPSRRRSAVSA